MRGGDPFAKRALVDYLSCLGVIGLLGYNAGTLANFDVKITVVSLNGYKIAYVRVWHDDSEKLMYSRTFPIHDTSVVELVDKLGN